MFNNHNPKLTREEYWDGMPEVHPETGIPSGNIWSSKHKDFVRPDLEKIIKEGLWNSERFRKRKLVT